MEFDKFGFSEVKIGERALMGYLYHLLVFVDKRSFLPLAADISNYMFENGLCEERNMASFVLNELNFEQLSSILIYFNILPEKLYIHQNDHNSKSISDVEGDLNIKNNFHGNHLDRQLSNEGPELDLNSLPIFYTKLKLVSIAGEEVIVGYYAGCKLVDVFSSKGVKLDIYQHPIETWFESPYGTDFFISNNLNSFIINLLGRVPAWAEFTSINGEFQFIGSKGDVFERCNVPKSFIHLSELEMLLKKRESLQFSSEPEYVQIGDQLWMATNLDVEIFRNGDNILQAQSYEEWEEAGENGIPAWCYYDDNPGNGEVFGKLYNWHAVSDERGLAPVGWHIPTLEEWEKMDGFLQDNVTEKLKGGDLWQEDSEMNDFLNYLSGNRENIEFEEDAPNENSMNSENSEAHQNSELNKTGFNALPGGARGYFGNAFFGKGDSAYWWTASPFLTDDLDLQDQAHFVLLYHQDNFLQIGNMNNYKLGMSVRCVKD
jgi:uncharacterized protein (TIGR02145 family)